VISLRLIPAVANIWRRQAKTNIERYQKQIERRIGETKLYINEAKKLAEV